ncbi:DEAD/DEAH box helicase family protein [Candidatus Saccharibacteria bacterium]|nr:DEAD/DEAH box helicase family protein [Candidatus Saccharibacteria bacterium]
MNAYKPRIYQRDCLDALQLTRSQGKNKALVVMASGLGKTLTGAFDIQEYLQSIPDGRVLVLCHSAAILTQTKETFKAIFGDGYSYGMYNGLEKAAHRTDFLFANLQSIHLHSDDFQPDEFCYVIVDEAHHSPAETYRKAIQYFTPQFLLGMTATPERMDDADLSEIFGETVYEYRLESAIKDGWLSDVEYRVKTDEIENLETYLDSGEKFSLAQLNREVFAPKRDEEIVRIIREEISGKDNPTMVIFCQTIAHAEKFAELMGDAVVIHSKLDSSVIAERLEGFRSGSIKTVCTVDMLNEGIDVPRTDVIVFLRVTQSKIVFTQQLGRGLRRAEGKDKVLVLDFVSTADRLEMLFQFEREFRSAVGRYPRQKDSGEREYFTLNIDAPVFKDRKVDIIALIERARSYAGCFTDEELIRDFRKECENLGRFPRQNEFYYHPSFEYRRRFKSLRNIAKLAGCMDYWSDYDQRSRNFPEDEALDLLADMFHELDRVPTHDEIKAAIGMPTPQYYVLHFGGVREALARRGIYPTQDQFPTGALTIWNKENIPPALRKLYEEIARPIQKDDLCGGDVPGNVSIRRVFGTITAACLYSGIPVNQLKPTKSEAALEIYCELGLPIDYKELCEYIVEHHNDPNSVASLVDLAGAKRRLNAIAKKGRPKAEPKVSPPKEAILEAIKLKAKEIGKTPTRRDMDADPDMPSSYIIKVVCGGYNNAIIEAGLEPNMSYSQRAKAGKRSKKASE